MFKEKKVVATIEARMASTRLPHKVMLEYCGKTNLNHIVDRVRQSKFVDEIVIATTVNPLDDVIEAHGKEIGCSVYRGSEDDVLLRVLEAAKSANADLIVEICGDCPIIDWTHIDQAVSLHDHELDYVNNFLSKTYPVGLAVQVFSVGLLTRVESLTQNPADREHVTSYIYSHPEAFNIKNMVGDGLMNYPNIALTLDTAEDYRLLSKIYEALYQKDSYFTANDTVEYLLKNSDLLQLNQQILRKSPLTERKSYGL